MSLRLIFDAHLDLAMNALEWNRDLKQPLEAIRKSEAALRDKPDRGRGTVSLPEMRRGGIGLCVATQIARVDQQAWSPVPGWRSPAQAWAMTQAQLAWYRAMEDAGELVQIRDRAGLERQLTQWTRRSPEVERESPRSPIGYILSLEGADSLRSLSDLEHAWQAGLRVLGPAHYGPGRYANGTDATGGFPAGGLELLREAERLGMILDATHLCDECFWQALDTFHGPVWSSHHNCRSLVPHNRQASDDMIRALIARGGVMGVVLDGWMLVPGWTRGHTTPQSVDLRLTRAVDHIDHICQIAGNARHVGIGSDLDGAFGTEQTPVDLESIADLQSIPELLAQRGYGEADVGAIAHGNFVSFLRRNWPANA